LNCVGAILEVVKARNEKIFLDGRSWFTNAVSLKEAGERRSGGARMRATPRTSRKARTESRRPGGIILASSAYVKWDEEFAEVVVEVVGQL
jgi:hypothetical protein